MKSYEEFVTSFDDTRVGVTLWEAPPATHPKGIVHVVHGLAEHRERYGEPAEFLGRSGFVVAAHELRGHGKRAAERGVLGELERGEFRAMVRDIDAVWEWLATRYTRGGERPSEDGGQRQGEESAGARPPRFLFGHSMGSILVRLWLATRVGNCTRGAGSARSGHAGDEPAGVILSGPVSDPGPEGTLASLLARLVCLIRGRRHRSTLLNGISLGTYTKAIRDRRTDFDWLSRDSGEVKKYIDDPACGFVPAAGFFAELFAGLNAAKRCRDTILPGSLSILLMSGEEDPVSRFVRGAHELAQRYRSAGSKDVTLLSYPGARHELLHETNRNEVFENLRSWLTRRI
jgi:alpha-beta hydrolase superfamily lysophospholipase